MSGDPGHVSTLRVYHFLRAEDAIDDLRREGLKVSRVADMNDPFETRPQKLKKAKDRKQAKGIKKDVNKRFGVLCFSRSWKNPLLWSHYADKHRGICLGFDIPDDKACAIIYVDARLDVDFDKQKVPAERDEQLGYKLLMTKFSGWHYEDEVRLLLDPKETTKDKGMLFYPFNNSDLILREVILGVRCRQSRRALRTLSGASTSVTRARLAFDSFDIVNSKAPRKS